MQASGTNQGGVKRWSLLSMQSTPSGPRVHVSAEDPLSVAGQLRGLESAVGDTGAAVVDDLVARQLLAPGRMEVRLACVSSLCR